MRAIVCDCCGKVVLLEDGPFWPDGINHLAGKALEKGGLDGLDLCDECTEKLIKATKGTEG